MTTATTIPLRLPLAVRLRLFAARVVALVQGDTEGLRSTEARFNEMLHTNNSLIASICLSFSRTKEDFEDLRQDSLVNIWNGINSFRGESLPSTWIYRVVLNTCVSYERKRQVGKKRAAIFNEFYRELFDESSHEDQERYEQMYRLIATLPPIDKSILLMWLDEKKYEEIAEVIGLSRDAVASRLKRTKDRLAEQASNRQFSTL